MTLQQDRTDVRHYTPPEHTPRLRLKPKAAQSGYVDGAWWPQSDDLAAELPDLLAVLSVRLGRIARVMYNFNEWAQSSAKLATGGRRVRLDGYRVQPTNTIEILGLNRNRIVLLVIPPNTDPDIAHEWMMTAAAPKNASTVAGARDRRRRPRTAHRLLSPDISPAHPEVSTMTVTVTLPGGGTDPYMRFGDAYVRHNDGTLDVIRGGAKRPYTSGDWTDVEGDQKKFNRRGFWR